MTDFAFFGSHLRALREQRKLSQRALALSAGIAVSFLSKVEAGKASPTLATLMKLAEALGMTVIELLSPPSPPPENLTVIPTEQMQVIDDGERRWQYLLPNHPRIRAVFTNEVYQPRTQHTELEHYPHDICGVVLEGLLTLEIPGHAPVAVQSGEAFYIKAGTPHVARNTTEAPVHLISIELLNTQADAPFTAPSHE